MASIVTIKANIAAQITTSTSVNSISEVDVGGNLDALASEIRDRGLYPVADDTAVASFNPNDSKWVITLDEAKLYRHNGVAWILILDPTTLGGGGGGGGADTAAPFIISGMLITPNIVRLSMNEFCQYSSAAGLTIGSPTSNPITAIAGTGTAVIDLTLTNAVAPGATVLLSYNPALGDFRDMAGNEMAAVPSFLITNPQAVVSKSGSLFGAGIDTGGEALGVATDVSGIFRKMPAGTVPDDVMTFDDGTGDVYAIVDQKAPYIARYGGVFPGSDQTARLNAIAADSRVNEIVLDAGDITISGNFVMSPTKKITFRNDARLVGTGTATLGIVDADMRSVIFDDQITIDLTDGARNKISVLWWGADPSNVADSAPAFQAAIDAGIRNQYTVNTVYVPAGYYRLDNGILLYRKAGNNYAFHSLNLEGETSWWHNSQGGSVLTFTNKDSFGVGVQAGKGNRISRLKLVGPWTVPSLTLRQFFNTEPNDFTDPTVIDTSYAGLFGIVIDPFVNNDANEPSSGTWATQGYPDWEPYYQGGSGSTTTGTTGVIMEDIFLSNWDACIACSPNGFTQNAEQLLMHKIQGQACRYLFCNVQAQEKNNIVDFFGVWGDCNTVFARGKWGAGTPGVWKVYGGNIAGNVRQLVDSVEGGYFASHFDFIFTESMGRFGRLHSLKGASVTNCELGFADPYYSKWQQKNIDAVGVTFKNCDIRYYGSLAPVTLYGQSVYDACSFEVTPYIGAWQDAAGMDVARIPNFINCWVDSSSAGGGWCGAMGVQSSPIGLNSANKLISPFGRKKIFSTSNHDWVDYQHELDYSIPYADIYAGNYAAAKTTGGGGEERLVITISGDQKWLWGNGSKLAVYASGIGYVGNIDSCSDTEVIIKHPVQEWVDGTRDFYVSHPIWHHHFAGTTTGGSPVISNVVLGPNWDTMANMVGWVIEAKAGVNVSTFSRWNIIIAQDGVNFTCLKNFYYSIPDCLFSTAKEVTLNIKNANADPNAHYVFKLLRGDKIIDSQLERIGAPVQQLVVKSGATAADARYKPLNVEADSVKHVSANYTPTIDDDLIVVDTTSGDITIQIPNRAYFTTNHGFYSGVYAKKIRIVKGSSDANKVIIAAFSGQNISGQTTIELTLQYAASLIQVTNNGNFAF